MILSLLAAIGICTPACGGNGGDIPVLEPKEFIERAKADTKAVILDVRTEEEYRAGHIHGARQLDYLDTEVFDKGMKRLTKRATYYIYCRSGKRSHAAALKMRRHGLSVVDMKGGYLNWTEQGLPTEK